MTDILTQIIQGFAALLAAAAGQVIFVGVLALPLLVALWPPRRPRSGTR